MGRAGWGAILNEDKGSSGTQNSVQQLLQSLSIPGDNEPTRDFVDMNVDKDREARRGITERIPVGHVSSGPSPRGASAGGEAKKCHSHRQSLTRRRRCA